MVLVVTPRMLRDELTRSQTFSVFVCAIEHTSKMFTKKWTRRGGKHLSGFVLHCSQSQLDPRPNIRVGRHI
jgi:hypothetical protein